MGQSIFKLLVMLAFAGVIGSYELWISMAASIEPAGWALFLCGLAVATFIAWRRLSSARSLN